MAGKTAKASKEPKGGKAAEVPATAKVAKAPRTPAKGATAKASPTKAATAKGASTKSPATAKPSTASKGKSAAPKAKAAAPKTSSRGKPGSTRPKREVPVGAARVDFPPMPVPENPETEKAYDDAMAALREVLGTVQEPIAVALPVEASAEVPSPIRVLPALDASPVIRLTDEQAEVIARASYERAVRGDTFDDLKRRASFNRQDAGRLRHWLAAAHRVGA